MFRKFLREQDVQLHHIATGVPRGNGQVERLMRTVFNLLRATLTDEKESKWTSAIAAIEDNINATIHSVTGYAPAVLHFGINPRLTATKEFFGDLATDNYIDPDKAIANARVRMRENANRQAQRFNATRYATHLFTIGDVVAIEDSQLAGGGKLKPKFRGPFTIRAILPNDRYQLHRKGQRSTVAAHDQLRPWPSVE